MLQVALRPSLGEVGLKRLSLISCLLCCLCNGPNYLFSSFSIALKAELQAVNVDILGSCIDIGAYTGILLSLAYYRYGPRVVAVLSACLSCGGYLGLAIFIPSRLPLPVYGFFCFCVGHGSYGMLSTCVAVCSQNESEEHRGKVIGALVCCTASTSLIFSFILHHAFDYRVVPFFYLMSIVLFVACSLVFLFVDNVKSPWQPAPADTEVSNDLVLTRNQASNQAFANSKINSSSTLAGSDDSVDNENFSLMGNAPKLATDDAVSVLLRTFDFWLLFATFFFFAGAGLMWKNVLGSLVECMTDAHQLNAGVTAQVFSSRANAVWSALNAFSRIGVGIVADFAAPYVIRPAWLVLASLMIVTGVGYLTSHAHDPASTLLASAFWWANCTVAIGYGAVFSTCNSLLSLLFGTGKLSRNFGLLILSPAISGVLVTVAVTAARNEHVEGAAVYLSGLLILVLLGVLAAAPSMWLTARFTSYKLPLNRLSYRDDELP